MISKIISLLFQTFLAFICLFGLLLALLYNLPLDDPLDPQIIASQFKNASYDMAVTSENSNYKTFLTSDNVEIQFIECGRDTSTKNETIVFLHGFPETAFLSWGDQITDFCRQGYHILAPDQRGYNQSGKPEKVLDYNPYRLGLDIEELITKFSISKQVILVVHDWGATVGNMVALHAPHLVKKFVLLNMGHLGSVQELMRTDDQLLRSWYMFLIQIPYFAENWALKKNLAVFYASAFQELAQKGVMGIPLYKKYMEQGAYLKYSILYYRALFCTTLIPRLGKILLEEQYLNMAKKIRGQVFQMPTLILFGTGDKYLNYKMASLTIEKYVSKEVQPQSKYILYDGVSHWVTHEVSQQVTKDITTFLA